MAAEIAAPLARTVMERADALAAFSEEADRVAFAWEPLHNQEAVRCDPELTELMARAAESAGTQPLRVASGAGHDAAVVAAIAPVTMLFVRCAGGVSHHPDEAISEADVAIAVEALGHFVEAVAARYSRQDGRGT